MDPRSHWRSPSFDGGRTPTSHHHRHPRFRGGGNNYPSPRHYSPQWQHKSPSSYHRFQNFQESPYIPLQRHPSNFYSFATSTPIHNSPRRAFHRGGGRFQNRQSFGSMDRSRSDDIDNWVSPQMWEDPWKQFMIESESTPEETANDSTQFAESDFSESVAPNETSKAEVESVSQPLDKSDFETIQ